MISKLHVVFGGFESWIFGKGICGFGWAEIGLMATSLFPRNQLHCFYNRLTNILKELK